MPRPPRVNSNIPQIAWPNANSDSLVVVVQALKQSVDSLAGFRGGANDRAVTFGDMVSLGFVNQLKVPSAYVLSDDLSEFEGGLADIAFSGNADDLVDGTVDPARISGSYTNIDGVGTLTTGVWQADVIAVTFGGTGADLSVTGGTSRVLTQETSGGPVTVRQLDADDLSDGVTGTGFVVRNSEPTINALKIAPATFGALTGPFALGQLAVVSDSSVNTWGATVSGGGAFSVLAWYNGTNWTVLGA